MYKVARAPSNIALIKYMGKADLSQNLPANSSLSLTLDQLCTFAEIHLSQMRSGEDAEKWIPELPHTLKQRDALGGYQPSSPTLSDSGINRVIRHVQKVRKSVAEIFPKYGIKIRSGNQFKIRTANTFPSSAGIASSASSFAAMTLATALASAEDSESFQIAWKNEKDLRNQFIQLSRQGSGSSCRSFGGPWVYWEKESVSEIESQIPGLTDLVFLVSSEPKETSSSDAHKLIMSSPLWNGRIDRANKRAEILKNSLVKGDLKAISTLAWQEMWEMHSLFHTCDTPFTFWEPDSLRILRWLKPFVNQATPPIVTMDAGANVHLLVPTFEALKWKEMIHREFPEMKLLMDSQGKGATWL